MKDESKTKAQLIEELAQLRARVAELEHGIARDITERKKAEEAMRESEAMLSSVLDNSSTVIFIKDLQGRYVLINQRYEELFHISRAQIVGKTDLDLFSAEVAQKFQDKDRLALEHGPIEEEELVPQDDGTHTYVSVKFPLHDSEGQPYAVCGIATDITARKQAEQELRQAHDQLQRRVNERTVEIEQEKAFTDMALNALPGLFYVFDRQGGMIRWNQRFVRLTGYSEDEIRQRSVTEYFDGEDLERVQETIEEIFEWGESAVEAEVIRKDGDRLPLYFSGIRAEIGGEHYAVGMGIDISERKRTEQALRDSERKFRALADGTPAGIAITQDERFIYANKAVMERSGMSWEAFSKVPAMETLSEPARAAGAKAMTAAIAQGEDSWRFEFLDDDGLWLEVTGSSTELDGREATIWTSFDVTDRKKIQEALENSEKRFRGLAETTNAHISIVQDDEFVYANQAFLDHNEMDMEDLACITPEDLMMGNVSPDMIANALPAWQTAMANGDTQFQFEYRDYDGLWFHTHINIMELDGKEAFLSTAFDITELKQAQEEVQQSAERYRTIFDTAGTGMISFGDDSVITLANEGWTELTGYSVEETVGKMTWMPFFTQASLEKMKEYHRLRSEDPASAPRAYEAQLVDRAGAVHDGIINIQLVPGTNQRVASFHDMTELKHAQQQMYRADKMAALGQIIAGVAHEINNPNNFIYFNLPILRRYMEAMRPLLERALEEEPELTLLNMPYDMFLKDMYKLLENMEHGSRRITSIVSDLKTYIRSGEDMEMKQGPLKPVIDQVMTLIGKQVRKMVRRFETEVADPLPLVTVNPGKLEQVLINLVINAGQAADKEDSWIRLSARTSSGGEAVEITVEDNGAGVPEDHLHQIFEPFYTSKGREEGTGLGLSISHQIIQDHGGTLKVQSEVGQGTCFTVRLPVLPAEPAPQ